MIGMVAVGLHGGGSGLFPTYFAVNEALRGAHILPSLVECDEKDAAVLGVALWQLERLGLEPQEVDG